MKLVYSQNIHPIRSNDLFPDKKENYKRRPSGVDLRKIGISQMRNQNQFRLKRKNVGRTKKGCVKVRLPTYVFRPRETLSFFLPSFAQTYSNFLPLVFSKWEVKKDREMGLFVCAHTRVLIGGNNNLKSYLIEIWSLTNSFCSL